MLDLVVRGGKVVTPEGVGQADIGVEDGVIVTLKPELTETAREEIDASGLHVFPGLIDVHVHFNEPGRTGWEGIKTGSSALAAGGGTLFVDMPLNSDPPLLTAKDFHAKKQAAEASSVTNFAFWGGLTPDNIEHLPELAELGVVGFKAFMSNSGIAEFKAADDLTLYRGMQLAARLGLPVAVHAESEVLTRGLTETLRASGGRLPRDYLASRPIIAELTAINRALFFAQETGCDLHVVHVSTARGIDLISEAKAKGVKVTAETCPHYLHFTDEDLERRGAVLKCAPPLRSEPERQALWQKVLNGEVDIIASDHSPAPSELKKSEDFFEVWGGIAGVQSTLQVLLTHLGRGLSLEAIAALSAAHPARRFGFEGKGRLEPGYHADLSLIDLNTEVTLQADDLFSNHKLSPYLGQMFKGQVKQTLLRGQTLFKDGAVVAKPNVAKQGRFVRPRRTPMKESL